jgi:hypothetical protein
MEQADRLLGFEVLQKALYCDKTPINPQLLGDKIGLHKGWSAQILNDIISKVNPAP